jgi:glycosyltransferase involved in cell wall biosynthesis
MKDVTLVIPGKDCSGTLAACLDSVVPLLDGALLEEIIFVNDGSSDDSAAVAAGYPVRVIEGGGKGPGAARNLGMAQATTEWVWFIDADCVAEADALAILFEQLTRGDAVGAGGSYRNMNPDSTLSCLIHEEIVSRHLRMPEYVDFLASFNILFHRQTLIDLGGFDPRFLKAQDAELSYRVRQAGYRMMFSRHSQVGHFHATRLSRYLRVQYLQGYWRVWLYRAYPQQASGDSYSGFSDHIQPVMAAIAMALLPVAPLLPKLVPVLPAVNVLILAAATPAAISQIKRTGSGKQLAYPLMSLVRAYARAMGMTVGLLHTLFKREAPAEPHTASIDAKTR